MNASRPEDLGRLFAEALNRGDLDALVALYEPGASLTPTPGRTVTGTEAIRASLAAFLAMKPTITLSSRLVAHAGDLALVTGQWSLSMTGPDGKAATVQGRPAEVARRQPDGRWLYAIDEPFGLAP